MDKFDRMMDNSLAEILGLENEYELLNKQAKVSPSTGSSNPNQSTE